MVKRIGVMTSGGDCPGLNTAIRAVVKSAINNYGYEVIGFRDGYRGLIENRFLKMKSSDVSGILDRGGTILGTINRYNPFAVTVDRDGEKTVRDMSDRIVETLRMHDIDCLVVIGGDATIRYANKLIEEKGLPIVAIPKTIENDIYGTDMSFGFMTAVDTATQAIDKLHSTAESHHRIMILEVMGRLSGWVALEAGIAGGADVILIPEIPYDINKVARAIFERRNAGKSFSIIVMSEGAKPKGSEGKNNVSNGDNSLSFNGTSAFLAKELERLTSLENRITVLGYLQRGGDPSPFDRILATRLGASAVNIIAKGEFNRMVCVDHEQIKSIPIKEVAGKFRTVPTNGEMVQIARYMGVSFGD
ncbi:MAG: 6-phosphofructokinase [Clostridiaceae bacterium]|nr:6-phosphofructokinase [Clostridiaceae bacterium]